MQEITAAAVQMTSTDDLRANLHEAGRRVAEAAARGARLVLLPENFAFMGRVDTDKLAIMEDEGVGPIQDFLAETAYRHNLWLVGGSVPLSCEDPGKVRAACLIYSPSGQRYYRYDKIHLFDVDLPDGRESYRESDTIAPGRPLGLVTTPFGKVGIAICYDIRFPEYVRRLSEQGMEILLVPAAFTATTGAAHWEILLRARAIENQCYVVAADQTGHHPGDRHTYGHSMIVDPWGKVLDRLGEEPGICCARLDPDHLERVRRAFPVLHHRRF